MEQHMEQRDYVLAGIRKKGSLAALARHLDQSEGALRNARNHVQGLPVYACVSLATLLEVTPMEIIAASELVTAKTEERRALFLPFIQSAKDFKDWHPVLVAFLVGVVAMADKAADGVNSIMCLI